MKEKKNAVCTVGLRQIEKNRDLALGAPQKDIASYEKIALAYGNVAPAVVLADGGMYRLIDGHARVEAYTRAGVSNVPVVVAQADDEAEGIKLSLLLATSRESSSPISEGAMIERLIKEHGHSLQGLSKFVGKSKSWLSKRQTMTRNLSQPLCEMILKGTVCARAAEEIAKLPCGEQARFAANAIRDGLSKDDIHSLVRTYRSPDATDALRKTIIESPSDALPACSRGGKTRKSRARGSVTGRIAGTARFAISILDEIGKMAIEYGDEDILAAKAHLLQLHSKLLVIATLIASRMDAGVSPGKREGQDDYLG